jgi:ferritin-like metal-binding protein YciE
MIRTLAISSQPHQPLEGGVLIPTNDINSTTTMKADKNKPPGGVTAKSKAENHKNLHDLFLNELADVLDAEKQLGKALPALAEACRSQELRAAFDSHLEETKQQITRLEQVFKSLEEPVAIKSCKAMRGLLEEGEDQMEEFAGSSALDAALIAAAQKVEHYEIASYGTVLAWAEEMGHTDAAELLERSLAEEKAADETLTEIALAGANQEAEAAEDEERPAVSEK